MALHESGIRGFITVLDDYMTSLAMKDPDFCKYRIWYVFGTLFLLIATSYCKNPSGQDSNNQSAAIDSLFKEYAVEGSPGASVMVIRDGAVIHSRGYGYAKLNDGKPMQPSTPVRLGSITKTFTAMAIAILKENGQLNYDSPVSIWVPELHRFRGITIRHLLNHTSGIPDYYSDSPLEKKATDPNREAPFTNKDAIAIYESWGEPLFAPGDRFKYSNPGYEVLAVIIERISGQSYSQFLQQHIFEPLGMITASVRDLPDKNIPGRAIGYSPRYYGKGWVENDDHWANWLVGAGGIYASCIDLYGWDQALYAWAETGERMKEIFSPAILNDGTVSQYGFGWFLSDRLGRPAISHEGGWVGFTTSLVRFPEQQLTVIVLSNASVRTNELANSIARIFLKNN